MTDPFDWRRDTDTFEARDRRREARRKERTRIVLGLWPRTLLGWWFWLRYWSPLTTWWYRWRHR